MFGHVTNITNPLEYETVCGAGGQIYLYRGAMSRTLSARSLYSLRLFVVRISSIGVRPTDFARLSRNFSGGRSLPLLSSIRPVTT